MVMALDVDATLLQLVSYFTAKVNQRVERRQGHVAFFVANVISGIRRAVLRVGVPDRFRTVNGKAGRLSLILITHIIEDEKLGFRTEINGIGKTSKFQVTLGATRDATRIEPVAFLGDRINDISNQAERSFAHEGVDPVAIRIRHQQHVGFVDRGPAAEARAVKAEAFLERFLGQLLDGECQVMPGSDQICETDVDIGRLFIGGKLQHIFDAHKLFVLFGKRDYGRREIRRTLPAAHHEAMDSCRSIPIKAGSLPTQSGHMVGIVRQPATARSRVTSWAA
jgi:hypothetical protein